MNNSNKIYPALIAIFFITAVDTMLSLTLFVLVALGSLRLLSKQLATTTLYLTEIGIVFGIVLLIVRFFTIKRNLSRVPLTSLALIKGWTVFVVSIVVAVIEFIAAYLFKFPLPAVLFFSISGFILFYFLLNSNK
ncbi:MAG TPA: hypothetical protein VF974_01410 [Patescibacteria group bacterium]